MNIHSFMGCVDCGYSGSVCVHMGECIHMCQRVHVYVQFQVFTCSVYSVQTYVGAILIDGSSGWVETRV